jgi:hypothetical protein
MSPKIPGRTLVSREYKVNEKGRNGARMTGSYLSSSKLGVTPVVVVSLRTEYRSIASAPRSRHSALGAVRSATSFLNYISTLGRAKIVQMRDTSRTFYIMSSIARQVMARHDSDFARSRMSRFNTLNDVAKAKPNRRV